MIAFSLGLQQLCVREEHGNQNQKYSKHSPSLVRLYAKHYAPNFEWAIRSYIVVGKILSLLSGAKILFYPGRILPLRRHHKVMGRSVR